MVLRRHRKGGRAAISILLVVLILMLAGGGFWLWKQSNSPVPTVERLGEAVKRKDWKTVYGLIDWSDGQKKQIDEKTFMTMAGVYGNVVTLESYHIGSASVQGETATVPVDMAFKVTGVFLNKEKTAKTDVKCRLVNGEWKLEPGIKDELLSVVGLNIGGR
jgi:hypothetical protein